MPEKKLQRAAFEGAIGPRHRPVEHRPEAWPKLIEGVAHYKDRELAEEFERKIWQKWGKVAPDEASAGLAEIADPEAKYRAALGLLSVAGIPHTRVKLANGRVRVRYKDVEDHADRVAAAIAAGEGTAIPLDEILVQAFNALGKNPNNVGVRYLLDARQGRELDDVIIERGSQFLDHPSVDIWNVESFLEWATLIHDPDRRREIITGGFRRRHWARSADAEQVG